MHEAFARLLSSDEVGRTLSFAELERLRSVDRSLRDNEFWGLAWAARIKIAGDSELRSILRLAIEAGKATHVRLIVKERPAVLRQDLDDDGNTCLTIASDKGNLEVVNALLEAARAADVLPGLLMRTNYEEESSLWIGAGKGRLEVVNALLEAARAAG